MFSVIGIGSIFSVFFHVATPEARFSEHAALMKLSNRHCQRVDMTWCDWLKEYQFYLVGSFGTVKYHLLLLTIKIYEDTY